MHRIRQGVTGYGQGKEFEVDGLLNVVSFVGGCFCCGMGVVGAEFCMQSSIEEAIKKPISCDIGF